MLKVIEFDHQLVPLVSQVRDHPPQAIHVLEGARTIVFELVLVGPV